MFAPKEDRHRDLGFKEGENPVRVLPEVVTLGDADSVKAGEAFITLNGTSNGLLEGLGVDHLLATGFGIAITITRSDRSVTMIFLGNATIEQYKQVILVAIRPHCGETYALSYDRSCFRSTITTIRLLSLFLVLERSFLLWPTTEGHTVDPLQSQ